MRAFQIVLVCLGIVVGSAGVASAADDVAPISPAALQSRMATDSALIVLDVRTVQEFEAGHVPGAVNIPHTDLEGRLSELDSSADIAVYCMKGPRARFGEKTLQEAGYDRLFHLEGGFREWQRAGLPVATGAPPAAGGAVD